MLQTGARWRIRCCKRIGSEKCSAVASDGWRRSWWTVVEVNNGCFLKFSMLFMFYRSLCWPVHSAGLLLIVVPIAVDDISCDSGFAYQYVGLGLMLLCRYSFTYRLCLLFLFFLVTFLLFLFLCRRVLPSFSVYALHLCSCWSHLCFIASLCAPFPFSVTWFVPNRFFHFLVSRLRQCSIATCYCTSSQASFGASWARRFSFLFHIRSLVPCFSFFVGPRYGLISVRLVLVSGVFLLFRSPKTVSLLCFSLGENMLGSNFIMVVWYI